MPQPFLGTMPLQQFFNEYWQKKPLLLRNVFPDIQHQLDADEIAGLALEDEVESRLICQTTQGWQLQQGPFSVEQLQQLPERDWTLLVQAVDLYLPEVAALWPHFNAIPNWRTDDIMISYAVPGGNVGPHIDQYDVFLIQAKGQRRWQVSAQPIETEYTLPCGLKQVAPFIADIDAIVQPGDVLYIPPKFAHHGVAQNECMTLSVGFRAPEDQYLLSRCVDLLLSTQLNTVSYRDPLLNLSASQQLSDNELSQLRQILLAQLSDPQQLNHLIGQVISEPKYPDYHFDMPEDTFDDLATLEMQHPILTRHPATKYSYYIDEKTRQIHVYLNGQHYAFNQDCNPLIQQLCYHNRIALKQFLAASSTLQQALLAWYNQGFWQSL